MQYDVVGRLRAPVVRLAAGVALLLLAVLLFAGSRVVAAGQQHSYDPGASAAKAYHLTSGETYHLSASVGVAALQKQGVLTSPACTWSADGELQNPLEVQVTDNDRELRTFASFTAPVTGELQLGCARIAQVFVDDSDGAGRDNSAILLLLTVAVGVAGITSAVSGGYALAANHKRNPDLDGHDRSEANGAFESYFVA